MLTENPLPPDGQPWNITTLRNTAGMTATFMDWGATWLSARVPLPDGSVREALLGCDTPADYLQQSAYLGAIVGRYANRIAGARLEQDGRCWPLAANEGKNQLHGGPQGFDKRRWEILSQSDQAVTYRLQSVNGDQGFPGNLQVLVCYQLDDDNQLSISYTATVDQACPVNLTNHAYFNLDARHGDARQHQLQLNADFWLPVDAAGLPAAAPTSVSNSGFDFRQMKTLARDFLSDEQQQLKKGYDHGFLLNRSDGEPAARLCSADGKLMLSVITDAPALQLYSGNYLAGTPARDQQRYADYQGIALETGFLADSPAHPEWSQPACWLQPGETFHSTTIYRLTAC